jgi:Biotin-lipoyl like/HlyD family secretion protein
MTVARSVPLGVKPAHAPGLVTTSPAVVTPAQSADAANAALLALLKAEETARQAASEGELLTLAANGMMRLSRARQVFVIKKYSRGFKVAAVSSLATFDPHAPLVQDIERVIARANSSLELNQPQDIPASTAESSNDNDLAGYPFLNMLWLPMLGRRKQQLGGLLLAREVVWGETERVVPERLAQSYAHAWQALVPGHTWWPAWASSVRVAAIFSFAAAIILLVPVPMTTLAPFETGSSQSFVVAAPMDGVIDEIAVEPNAAVKAGDVLVRLNDVTSRNRLDIAEHEVSVAQARMTQTNQLAFGDARGRHDIGISRAEHALKVAERDYAREMLKKSQIRAPRDGLAVFADKRNLIGKPVATGERIMEISDPQSVELRIDVAVSDSISVRNPSPLKAFFDADPLRAQTGTVRHADYQARMIAGDVLAYRVLADLDARNTTLPRLGSRGTVQLYGEPVPLAYFLFRRPLTALRQRFGL